MINEKEQQQHNYEWISLITTTSLLDLIYGSKSINMTYIHTYTFSMYIRVKSSNSYIKIVSVITIVVVEEEQYSQNEYYTIQLTYCK